MTSGPAPWEAPQLGPAADDPASPDGSPRVVVRLADLDAPPLPRRALDPVLDTDERARERRFRYRRDRRRFAAGRGLLRHALAGETGRPAGAIRFAYGPGGKPALACGPGPAFNLSHSENLLAVAVGARGPLGVDVELLRPRSDPDGLGADVFTKAERALLSAADARERSTVFLSLWTAKEAFLKATGMGLGIEPRDVALVPDLERPVWDLLATGHDGEPPEAWRIHRFRLPEADGGAPWAVGAVAVRARDARIVVRSWRPGDGEPGRPIPVAG